MNPSFTHAMRFGAQSDGEVTRFRLWAPDAVDVALEIEGQVSWPLPDIGDGWRELVLPAAAGTRYRYRVDEVCVPDPAARAQDGGVHGWSVVVDPRAYRWRISDWCGRPWHETVLYEIHAGLAGGFDGVAAELERLAALGITAVELMPIAAFPGERNWGYDGVLPFAPQASYGTPEALKALVDRTHELGLMVFLDVVYNHFGPDGNYLGLYAKRFFRENQPTPWGAAIDFRRPEVREFFIDNALYWLDEYRIDGLRLDAVHAITERDWLVELARRVHERFDGERHVHLVLENEQNDAGLLRHGFDAQWNDDGHHCLHVLLTDEREGYYVDYADAPAARLARCLADGFVYQGEVSPHRGLPRGTSSADLPPTAFVLFLQNHDQIGNRAYGERLTTLAHPAALRTALALVLLAPQIPLLFFGEERGARAPFLYFTDHSDGLGHAVREGRRAEFARFAAFSDPARRETIPDPNAANTFERSRPSPDDHDEVTAQIVATALTKRRDFLVAKLPSLRARGAGLLGPYAVAARWHGDGGVYAIHANLGDTQVVVERADLGAVVFEQPAGASMRLAAGELGAHSLIATWHTL